MAVDTPCRVKADLTTHDLFLRDMGWKEFDPHDDDLIADIVANKRLREPVQNLLILAQQYFITEKSFGVDRAALGADAIPHLMKLLHAAVEEWRDL